ncbi:hypothetical protein PSACC_02487, partial [Paramicrosporidium saccamoebae]
MRLSGLARRILWPAATLLLLHLSREVDAAKSRAPEDNFAFRAFLERIPDNELVEMGRRMHYPELELALEDFAEFIESKPELADWSYSKAAALIRIAPRAVKSAKMLQYLFRIGYNQIPKFCLQSINGQLTISAGCARWLAINDCSSLLDEMLQENPDLKFIYSELFRLAIREGSIDVMKQMHERGQAQIPSEESVRAAVESNHFEAVKLIFEMFGDQIDWSIVVEGYSHTLRSDKMTKYLLENVSVTSSPS